MINLLKQKNKNNSGFTLVETLVAISIFTISILALMSVLAKGMSDTNYAKQQMTASYLAQEGIEYIRNMRDTSVLSGSSSLDGWNAFISKISVCNLEKLCGFDSSISQIDSNPIFFCSEHNDCRLFVNNGDYNIDPNGADSGFTRTIISDTTNLGNDEIKIISKVEWTQGSGTHNVTFSENLYNWIE